MDLDVDKRGAPPASTEGEDFLSGRESATASDLNAKSANKVVKPAGIETPDPAEETLKTDYLSEPFAADGEPRRKRNFFVRIFSIVTDSLNSSLTRRIFTLNITALVVFLGVILYMNQFRAGLIDARVESLLTQGRIIAGAIAGSATATPDAITIDPEKLLELKEGESLQPRLDPLDNLKYPINPEQVAPLLRQLLKPTQTRARIYDPDGILILDSKFLYSGGQIQSFDLPRLDAANPEIGWMEYIGNILNRLLGQREYPVYREISGPGTQYPEVQSALTGAPQPIVRMTQRGRLMVSVAVPVQRFRAVLGALLLSTEGDDIDRIVREERIAVLRIFLVAAVVILALSALLAGKIARPLKRLSEAAQRVKRGVKSRVELPDFSGRNDEIGDLSSSIGEMTNALYQRIEAIERFAADVSHELKNPLTSLRSAAETLPLAKTPEARARLLEIVQHDVKRLDRLITDISDASRLDADLVRDQVDSIDFEELVKNVIDASQQVAKRQKPARISFRTDHDGKKARNYFVRGHETRLGQVLNNLLDNALSFVPENDGQITVGLARNEKTIFLVVEDNGPGIPPENAERIFERFYTDREHHGGFGQNSGLGLSISRQIIEAHGGSIRVANRTDGTPGARFIVSIPAAKIAK